MSVTQDTARRATAESQAAAEATPRAGQGDGHGARRGERVPPAAKRLARRAATFGLYR